MSLRDEFEKWYVGRFPNALLDRDGESYYFAGPRGAWEAWKGAYQSATERALRIVREEMQGYVPQQDIERRLKGDDNG